MRAEYSIGTAFATRPNALSLIRLVLALEVVVWHSYALRGSTWLPDFVEGFLADLAVDAFLAISGFLIARAWARRSGAVQFLAARATRLLPGLWACLLVTAFVIAPTAAWLAGREGPTLVGQLSYVSANAGVWMFSSGIDGGPVGIPQAETWNGSLWSLGYEATCYLAVIALGLAGLMRPRVVGGIAAMWWLLSAALVVAGIDRPGSHFWLVPRCGLMFACGALLWFYRDRVPLRRDLVGAAAFVVVVSVAAVPANYRLMAAPALAYLCLATGLWLGRHRRLVLRHDLSYGIYVYGFPLQQALLLAGLELSWVGFATASLVLTLPIAALSWFLIERPVQRWRLGRRRAPLRDAAVETQAYEVGDGTVGALQVRMN